MKVYINGKLIDAADAKVSVLDRGFLLGEGLFETMRAYHGTVFMLERHLDRLAEGAEILGFEGIPGRNVIKDACQSVIGANKLNDARLRVTLTPGSADSSEPTIVITALPFTGYDEEFYDKGMSAIVLPGFRISGNPIHNIKTTSYLPSVIARQRAVALSCDEAILINELGNITEGSYTNIFAVKADTAYTPPIEDGLLPGITRECVIDVAVNAGYPVLQQSIPADDLQSMDELFLTNSLMEVMPLTRVDGYVVGRGIPGPVTLELLGLYKKRTSSHLNTER